ncbi:MAG: N-acylglucosamine 2-epimerase [Hyphomicrobiales bacterium]|nr:N-acylglucosamine 2-epimerase [Hyphomicrobiales bacterium]
MTMTMHDYSLWVREQVLPYWFAHGFNARSALFYEKLYLDGSPDRVAELRLRTHMRQVYVFAHSAELGFLPAEPALAMADAAMTAIREHAWAPDGRPGWAHRLTQSGRITDPRRDLYDHAFALHALAWMAKATGEDRYRAWIDDTLAAIETLMAAPAGGWAESDGHELPRRQNPHMHMFEACLALFETSGDPRHLARTAEIAGLFRARFFDEELKVLREFFGPEWQLADEFGSERLEPGHMVEWVWLLRRYERSTGLPVARLAADLFTAAERVGMDGASFLLDEVSLDGTPTSDGRRLWPQTEYLKACLVQHEDSGDATFVEKADQMVDRLFKSYLRGRIPGLWVDRFDLAGRAAVDHVPASIVYHLLAPVVEFQRHEPGLDS